MSAKQLVRLALALAIVLAAWAAVALANRSGQTAERDRFLPTIDTAAVDTVVVTKGRDTLHVVRSASGYWRTNGYPTSSYAISQLLRGLVDSATAAELVAVNPSSHAQFGVTADSARQIRVMSRGHTAIDLLAGGRPSRGAGVYVRLSSDPKTYLVQGPLLDPLTLSTQEWYERTIATIPSDSVDTITIGRGTSSYTLQRGNGGWTLATGAPADSAAVAQLLARYRTVGASGFATPAQAESLHFDPPFRRARLVGHKGKVLANFVFDSIGSGVWIRHDSGGPAYLIDSWTAPRMTPGDTAFRKH